MKTERLKEESIGRWISMLHRYAQAHVGRQLEQYGIGKGQFIVLAELMHLGGAATQDSLAVHLSLDKGTTARALSKLEDEGYIVRKRVQGNKRAKLITLTDKAHEVWPEVKHVLSNWTEALADGFSEDERDQLLDMLYRLANNACKTVRELDGMPCNRA